MFFSPKRKGQEKNIAETQCKDVNGNAINMKICSSKFIRRSSSKSSGSNFFLSLYKNTKQKETFDIQYKFLHFVQPSLTRFGEIWQNFESRECERCNRPAEAQKHWLFSCSYSQNVFIYLLCLLEYIDITQVIDNTVEDFLLHTC